MTGGGILLTRDLYRHTLTTTQLNNGFRFSTKELIKGLGWPGQNNVIVGDDDAAGRHSGVEPTKGRESAIE